MSDLDIDNQWRGQLVETSELLPLSRDVLLARREVVLANRRARKAAKPIYSTRMPLGVTELLVLPTTAARLASE